MVVYRVDPASARLVERELAQAGIRVEVQHFATGTYVVVRSDRDDLLRLIRRRAPKAVFVPDLADLT